MTVPSTSRMASIHRLTVAGTMLGPILIGLSKPAQIVPIGATVAVICGTDVRYGSDAREIVAAARDTFLEKGFERAAVSEIAAKVGVGEGLLYFYFPTKRDLLKPKQVYQLDDFPHAVKVMPNGFFAVDYGQLPEAA